MANRRGQLSILALIALVCTLAVDAQTTIPPRSPISPIEPAWAYRLYVPIAYKTIVPQQGAGMTTADCEGVAALGIEWVRTWHPDNPVCISETVPMVMHLWQIGDTLSGDSQYVFYLNEPENPVQSDVPGPGDAAIGLLAMLTTYPNRKVVLPSASESYLDAMLLATGDVPLDRLVVDGHCYGWGALSTALTKCKAHADALLAWADSHGISEVWVSEFGLDPAWYGGMPASVAFVEQMVDYYRTIGIDRWAYFQVNSTAGRWSTGEMGLYVDGQLTALGVAYRALGEAYR